MFTQQQLRELDNANSFIVQRVAESDTLIIHSPMWESWEWNDKVFSVYTSTFNTHTEFINHIMWNINTMVNLEYISEEEYKNKKYDRTLI